MSLDYVPPRRGGIKVGPRDIPLTDALHVRLAVSQWRDYEFPGLEAKREAAQRVREAAARYGVELRPPGFAHELGPDVLERAGEVEPGRGPALHVLEGE